MGLTRTWRTANPKDGSEGTQGGTSNSFGGGGFFQSCLPEKENERRRLAEYRPSDELLQYYDRIVDESDVCQGQWLLNISSRLAAAPASLAPKSMKKDGVLGEFTTIGVVDPGYASIQSAVMTNGGKILGLSRDKNMVSGD